MINALNQQSNGWVSLAGDTAVVGPDGQLLTAFTVTPTLPKTTEVLVQWLQRPFVLFLLGALAILFFLMLIPFLRRLLNRLRFWRPGPTEDPADTSTPAESDPELHDPLAHVETAHDSENASDETTSNNSGDAPEPSESGEAGESSEATSAGENAEHTETPSDEQATPADAKAVTSDSETVAGSDDVSTDTEAAPSSSESPGTDGARGDQGDEPPVS